jgi:hypothetical protein
MNFVRGTLPLLPKPVYSRGVRRFTVIEGSPEPDTPKARSRSRVRAMERPAEMLQCRRCGGREFTETVTGALVRRGKMVGGTKTLVCVTCLLAGERVTAP